MVAVVTFTWQFAQNVASFVAIAVFLGLLVQRFVRMGPLPEIGLRIGMGTVVAIGVITGSPISGALVDGTGSFKDVGYVGGCTMPLSAALMAASRHFLVRSGGAPGGRE